jgi:hypothetical protein
MSPSPRKACLAILLLLASAPAAFPWGREGHAAVGIVARDRLSDSARAHVVKILGNDDLGAVASWMDELRTAAFHTGALAFDPEALAFNHEFPKNGEWHYVDLPLDTPAYEPNGPFSRPDDVVHAIAQAVNALEGKGDPRISPKIALYMLVHFVGDLHQPLHVGNGFYEIAPDGSVKLVTSPAAARTLPNDKGGNALFFGAGRYDELHAYWDVALVTKITGSDSAPALAKVLEARIPADGSWKSPGDRHDWAAGWATESLAAARTAYAGIMFGPEIPDPKGGIQRIKITFPAHYDDTCVPLAEQRLAQAGYHLGEILNAIRWSD